MKIMKSYKLLPVITGFFVAVLLISGIMDVKIFKMFSMNIAGFSSFDVSAGCLLFPLGYIFGDILTEVYGYSNSRKVIWTGFGSLLLFMIFSQIAIYLPPAEDWNLQDEYAAILGQGSRIMVASIIAYFFGEFANSFVLAKMKVMTAGKKIAGRFIASTILGQTIDTSIFCVIAFWGVMPLKLWLMVLCSSWLIKISWEILALPISLSVVKWIKKVEKEDYFDEKTNFNPFVFS